MEERVMQGSVAGECCRGVFVAGECCRGVLQGSDDGIPRYAIFEKIFDLMEIFVVWAGYGVRAL